MKLTVRFEVGGGGGEMGMIITGLLGREVGEWRPKLEAQYFQGGGKGERIPTWKGRGWSSCPSGGVNYGFWYPFGCRQCF